MYHVCDKAGNIIATHDTIESARQAVEGTALHIRYSQAAVALERARREAIAQAEGHPGTPVFYNGDFDDVAKALEKAKRAYSDWEKHCFQRLRALKGGVYLAPTAPARTAI